jgi:hypothetical protein
MSNATVLGGLSADRRIGIRPDGAWRIFSYSANRLGLMSERQYRNLNVKMKVLLKNSEPRAIRKMAEVAFGSPLPFDQMEKELHISAEELEGVLSMRWRNTPSVPFEP